MNRSYYKTLLAFIGLVLYGTSFCQITPPGPYNASLKVNYIRTWTAKAPEQNPAVLITRPVTDVLQTTQYYDGLGRPIQGVLKKGSPMGFDMVVTDFYDSYGREPYQYIPFISTSSDGNIKADPYTQQITFSQNAYPGETYYYQQVNFESSPGNRVTTSFKPGNNWVGASRGTKTDNLLNTLNDNVRIWSIAVTAGSLPTSSGAYAQGTLKKFVTTDASNKQIIEYQDLEGSTILKKVQLDAPQDNGNGAYAGWLSTYYVYDDFKNLRFVISPNATAQISSAGWTISQSIADGLCFRYEYDQLNRMIIKKEPGVSEVWMVYDALDRLVMSQDQNLRDAGKWSYTQYDVLDRSFATGLIVDAHDRNFHAAAALNVVSYPNLGAYLYELLTHTLYDDYSWLPSYPTPFTALRSTAYDGYFLSSNTVYPYPQLLVQSKKTQGKVTGMRVAIPGTGQMMYVINYYDDAGRVIQTQNTNQTGAVDIITTQYDYAGRVLETYRVSGPSGQQHSVIEKYKYDALGRRTNVWQNIDNLTTDKLICTTSYNESGRPFMKTLGNGIENLTYDYNILGWLTGINKQYLSNPSNTANWFGMELAFDKTTSSGFNASYASAQYNGNIAGTLWRTKGDGQFRKYDFTYDGSKRLLKADFNQLFNTQYGKFDPTNGNYVIDFSEYVGNGSDPNLAYDANGNILAMKNWGIKTAGQSPVIDDLKYKYPSNSNQLQNVLDAPNDPLTKLGDFRSSALYMQQLGTKTINAVDYLYDGNGNLIKDLNKDIGSSSTGGIQYNILNLPTIITVNNTIGTQSTVTYVYDALGSRLSKTVVDKSVAGKTVTSVLSFIGGAIYLTRTTVPTDAGSPDCVNILQAFSHEEGRARYIPPASPNPAKYVYDYFIRDNLSNVRMVLTEENWQEIYPACTLEGTGVPATDPITIEKNFFYTIVTGQVISSSTVSGISAYQNNNGNPPVNNNPNCNNTSVIKQTDNSQKLYLINASTTAKTGLGITLKVMSGDKIDVLGKSYYTQLNTGGQAANLSMVALDLLNGLLGTPSSPAAGHGTATQIQANTIGVTSPLNTFINNHDQPAAPTTPRAYINYIVFDEQFNFVTSGMSQVGSPNIVKSHYVDAALQNITIVKNGYVYIYCSNESPVNVYFDNLQVILTHGPLLEETHYYPFGLAMAGISSKALNKLESFIKYNGKEFQHKEFGDGTGLECYDYTKRFYDNQTGRFFEMDGLASKYAHYSPYQFAGNQVPGAIDMDGLEPMSETEDQTEIKSEYNNYGQYVSYIYDPDSKTNNTSKDGLFYTMTYPGTNRHYYWKNNDGTPGIYDPATAKDKDGNWTGVWQRYLTAEDRERQVASKSADIISTVFAGLVVAPFAIEALVTAGAAVAEGTYTVKAYYTAATTYYRYAPMVAAAGKTVAGLLDESGSIGLQNQGLRNGLYPLKDGFLNGTFIKNFDVGNKIGRYGEASGRYFTTLGTPPSFLSLPLNVNRGIFRQFVVTKPFSMEAGRAAPYYNQIGLGRQYKSFFSLDHLIEKGYLEELK